VIFPVCALWTLYNFPTARLMYMSATYDQVVTQFISGLTGLLQLAAFSFRTIKYWSGFAGDF
jgi:hypothetical protein